MKWNNFSKIYFKSENEKKEKQNLEEKYKKEIKNLREQLFNQNKEFILKS